ncbi:MAG: histidine kinase dimerization/phosphoacceptor domain -containing protein [Pseudomonadota bacterium]
MLRAIEPAEIVASLRESLLVLTEDLVVEYANDRFLKTFEVNRVETVGVRLDALGNGQWDIPSLTHELDRMVEDANTVENVEIDHHFEHIGRRVMRLNARKTVRPGNGSRRILLAIEDVTAEADLAEKLERERLLSTGIVETIREPLLVLNEQLSIISANRAFYRSFRVQERETVGRSIADLGNGQWAIPKLLDLLTNVVPQDRVVEDFEVQHSFLEIGNKTMLLNARKVYREGNATHMLLLAIQDITERRRLEAERKAALEQAGRLLEELNHRVMNSLAMIGSIISMEARNLSDDETKAAFTRMRARVDAVGSLYRTLSRAGSVDTVGTRDYLSALTDDLVASSGRAEGLRIRLDIADVPLSTRVAVPLGLVVNELITNSLKYAYNGRSEGVLSVSLLNQPEKMTLEISDDGPGIDPKARVDSGLGQKLIDAFATQLGGTVAVESDRTGTRHTLAIPV